jgi:hypothetical protein
VTTPAKKHPQGGVSGNAGVTLNDWVTVNVQVRPQGNGDILCDVNCNGKEVLVNFQADGDIDTEVKAS